MMTKNLNKTFMAVKVGKESVEGSFKMYKGMAAFNIVAVNPDKKELEAIIGRETDKEPEYVGKSENGKPQVRVVFYAKTNDNVVNNGIDLMIPISFMLTREYRIGQAKGKYQIIDKFGRTAWATKEEVQAKIIPQYPSGAANISADYRPIWQGEEALIDFLIQWLNIPSPAVYKDKTWVMKENTEDSEVALNMDELFKGDFSELKNLVELAPAYAVKAAVGIRTVENENGTKQYHAVFTRKFAKNAITDYSKIDAAITDFQSNGGAPSTVFSVEPLHENVITATPFVAPTEDPFASTSDTSGLPWD